MLRETSYVGVLGYVQHGKQLFSMSNKVSNNFKIKYGIFYDMLLNIIDYCQIVSCSESMNLDTFRARHILTCNCFNFHDLSRILRRLGVRLSTSDKGIE